MSYLTNNSNSLYEFQFDYNYASLVSRDSIEAQSYIAVGYRDSNWITSIGMYGLPVNVSETLRTLKVLFNYSLNVDAACSNCSYKTYIRLLLRSDYDNQTMAFSDSVNSAA